VKLLFDENLSHRLCALLDDVFPLSAQVRGLGLEQANDEVIWARALAGAYAIVSLDADFAELSALRGAPPKVIWLRCGNQTTAFVAALLRAHATAIIAFVEDAEASCLEVY